MKHALIATWLLLHASVAYADLKYTTHVEVRILNADPSMAKEIGALLDTLPRGDTVAYLSGDAVRIEQTNGGRKSVVLLRAEGQTILDPSTRTYMRVPEFGGLLKDAASQPAPQFRRTGEFTSIAGIQVERVEVIFTTPLPVRPLPGFPTVATLRGDVWLAATQKGYAAAASKAIGFLPTLPPGLEGIVMRQLLRSSELGYETESTVTELVEAPLAADLFAIPPDYREISSTLSR